MSLLRYGPLRAGVRSRARSITNLPYTYPGVRSNCVLRCLPVLPRSYGVTVSYVAKRSGAKNYNPGDGNRTATPYYNRQPFWRKPFRVKRTGSSARGSAQSKTVMSIRLTDRLMPCAERNRLRQHNRGNLVLRESRAREAAQKLDVATASVLG